MSIRSVITPWREVPPPWPQPLAETLRERIARLRQTVVVLDDDPTGTQTVHDTVVLTAWTAQSLRTELAAEPAALYLLTNTRSMPEARAVRLNAVTGAMITEAARQAGRNVSVVSRGDSTLRGHFPQETVALGNGLGGYDCIMLVPAYPDAGRVTVDGLHWVDVAGSWTPAGATPYAGDPTFGYTTSHLASWVAERTGGAVSADAVQRLTLEDVRTGGPHRVAARLGALSGGVIVACDALDQSDLQVLALGAVVAQEQGARVLHRSAAAMVAVRAGIPGRAPLTDGELLPSVAADHRAGLVIVGSYVPTTTRQLDMLRAEQIDVVGVDAASLARGDAEVIARAAAAVDRAMGEGRDVVVHTSRTLLNSADPAAALNAGAEVSRGLVSIVRAVRRRPAWVVAKGGITSSDIATHGLGIRRAWVVGQILTGVPVWRAGPEARHPGLTYVVFPGNVGADADLAHVVRRLQAAVRSGC